VGGDAAGSALGVLGLPAAYAGTAAKFFGVGVKAIPGVGIHDADHLAFGWLWFWLRGDLPFRFELTSFLTAAS
jgi:hypothetical protein